VIFTSLCVLIWICIWEIAAIIIDNPLLLPSPITVAKRLFSLACETEFYVTTAASLWRIARGLIIGTLIGIFTSALASRFDFFRVLFSPLIAITKATPVASFIILIWSFTGGEILPVFVSAIIVVPVVHSNLVAGFTNISTDLREAARIFELSFSQRMKLLYFPSVLPYFISAFTSALGLAWKAGIAAEVLAYTTNSIGHEIYKSKAMLEISDLFAWTLTVVVISMIFEYAIKKLFNLLPRGYRDAAKQ
jgi:NitT/TauT family transport system permease protein